MCLGGQVMTMTASRAYASAEARRAIEAVNRKELTEEVEYRIGVQREGEDYDFDDYMLALLDTEEWFENNEMRAPLNAARRALIALGRYREITAGELARTQRLGGGKKYDFQLSGKKYVWAS